ncbi:MAG: flagellar biosynthesis protein FliQ [Burkholderiales bacterium]|jgi:flagellar biosynthetic protein FliQ|nr:flagellar biosynthesis protein FliQ [Microcystis sp. M015S1]MCA3148855.1 flagellar biosynthesis protein FliQ [Burkholderiales bacterium]MCA3153516.1 flagellar biosynthesis protein FliQ [Burkholderiales bacterium]MCA3156285.1 flagellar biosynthesis protein FliQ [Burkholderiales bacterium]MCA3159650.1 flagellar biosynthesis protein FliQ [Burkholderiales bacterium]
MNSQNVLSLGMQAMEAMLMMSAPLLLTALIIGLLVSIFQAATQINEQTLSFIPKLVAMIGALAFAGPWMISMFTDFMRRVFESIPVAIG